ncbi:polysaccharide pyruvyl transferase family protein [Modestobacter italicus]|uniref:polysaccharide pyruvyl transferase family protein n=1 Tax=Modestobacter italicus (strain DSM 44449 / CECT 9708 / BC 501) TaxID=2732864 RepID=UPI00031C616E|nr:polysaccharide pyruvyl transferase family protein [Modestobacter marinus]
MGWSGNGNLGDDAMIAAHRRLLPGWDVTQVPNHGGFAPLSGAALRRVAVICLGGGTLVLNGHFRETLERLMRAAPDAPRVMLGVGVEDLEFREGRRAAVLSEVATWRPLLTEFEQVRVRGPLSQRTVASMGLDSVVVGDPAIALPDQSPGDPTGQRPSDRARIGVNFGVTDDLWGGDHAAFRSTVVAAIGRLVGAGHDVALLATTVQDRVHLSEVARECSAAGVTVAGPNSVGLAALDTALKRCSVVVGEKLHALVLAARLGIPTLALEYRPKCRDFQLSVGRGDWVLRTDDLTVEALVDFVTAGLAAAEEDRAELRRSVEDLGLRLERAAESMRLAMGRVA